MSMNTDGTVVTVTKSDKLYLCTDQFGNQYTDIPDWRWRRAYNGNFQLIKKFDANGKVNWKRYYEDYDGPIVTEKATSILTSIPSDTIVVGTTSSTFAQV
jgi:hypothetical protein